MSLVVVSPQQQSINTVKSSNSNFEVTGDILRNVRHLEKYFGNSNNIQPDLRTSNQSCSVQSGRELKENSDVVDDNSIDENNEPSLKDELQCWATNFKISHTALKDLLHILSSYHPELPLDSHTKKYLAKLGNFICDAPAKAFIKGIKAPGGYSCCDKCTAQKEYINGREVLRDTNARKRSDHSFRLILDDDHHVSTTPLVNLEIDMIQNFPIDYMHNICLGVYTIRLPPSSLLHTIRGWGCPVALQVSVTFSPSATVMSPLVSESSMSGGTATRNRDAESLDTN
ncbi:unnamed protein product [Acanthoscelides obtectus]|uniref:Uncharacterized protein n=1 Tax=Acanthoscelides obtectus TaxID=200917 RepID=A0A9P0QAQ8_ACAOB|nr:unnamed protein product [Acanthoscelides obtectus]CAK1685206.1 hypothetical protein AOBTE_LOCUS35259 [Acanthoscelides obtectus]